jgi:CheY-like chemotaxis protein
MPGRSILIVEDDAASADVFVSILTDYGCDVRVAADADEAMCEIERRAPAALLIDLHLATGDGIEFVRRLRAGGYADVPAAIMTADYLVDDRVTDVLRALGVPLYFKPLWEEDLVGIMSTLLPPAGEFPDVRGKFHPSPDAP